MSWAAMVVSTPSMRMPVNNYRAIPIVRAVVSAIPTIIHWRKGVVIGDANFCSTTSKKYQAG
jgi:hypothetical protein